MTTAAEPHRQGEMPQAIKHRGMVAQHWGYRRSLRRKNPQENDRLRGKKERLAFRNISFAPVRIWDVRAKMSTKVLMLEACTRRLPGPTTLSCNETRLAGHSDTTPAVDICAGIG